MESRVAAAAPIVQVNSTGSSEFESKEKMQSQHIRGANATSSDLNKGLRVNRRPDSLKRPAYVLLCHASFAKQLAILAVGQVSVSAQQMFGLANGSVKRQVFQPLKWIALRKALHRPEGCDGLTGLGDLMAQALPFFCGKSLKPLSQSIQIT